MRNRNVSRLRDKATARQATPLDMTEPLLLGAHMSIGGGVHTAIERGSSINRVFRKIPKVKTQIALETTAGQGSCLGHRFEQIAYIIQSVREPERLCVCLDTAHVFAAGYDIGSEAGTKKTFREFDRVIGFNRLAAIHLNDSKTVRGSRVDRHQHIGKGQIGLDAFRFIMRDRRFRKIPKVLETPKGRELREDVANMKTLRGLLKTPPTGRAIDSIALGRSGEPPYLAN